MKIRILSLIVLAVIPAAFAHADRVAESEDRPGMDAPPVFTRPMVVQPPMGLQPPTVPAPPSAPYSSKIKLVKGQSWRNVKNMLLRDKRFSLPLQLRGEKAAQFNRCGSSALHAPACLAKIGMCRGDLRFKRAGELPVGAVIVYGHRPYGNAVLKVRENLYLDNEFKSSPPRPRPGSIAAYYVPCDRRAR